MKKIKINKSYRTKLLAIALMSALLLGSCQKFLDVKTASSLKSLETAVECQALMDNYGTMNMSFPGDGELAATDNYVDDGTYNGMLNGEEKRIYTWSSEMGVQRDDPQEQWSGAYQVVYQANLVLETIEKLKGGNTDPAVLNGLRGSALFYRAYAFYQLAQIYTKPYSAATATQDSGIPLRLKSDINTPSSRGTVQQTYDQIINDLTESVSLLPTVAPKPTRPSKIAVYGFFARMYLGMEKYPEALANATAALQINHELIDFNTINRSSDSPLARFNAEEVFYSAGGGKYLGANYAYLYKPLVESFENGDLRRETFAKAYNGGYYFTGFEPDYGVFTGIAVDELYLIRAECYARAENTAAAMSDLNTLLIKRYVNTSARPYINKTASSTNDALVQILDHRHRELLLRGTRWTDLRRLNKDPRFAVTLAKTVNDVTYTLPPNDPRYTLLIPDQVIKNSSIIQNKW